MVLEYSHSADGARHLIVLNLILVWAQSFDLLFEEYHPKHIAGEQRQTPNTKWVCYPLSSLGHGWEAR